MTEKSRYFVLKQKAVPEVLLKVVEVMSSALHNHINNHRHND